MSSVRHLYRATGLPKPTIVRLLDTLVTLGYVVNDRRQGGYQVTSLVRSLSARFHVDPLVVEAARPSAIAFTRKYEWPVAIAVLDRDAVAIRFSTIPTARCRVHATINTAAAIDVALGAGLHRVFSAERTQPAAAHAGTSNDPEMRPRATALRRSPCGHDPTRGLCRAFGQRRAERSSTLAVPLMLGRKSIGTVGIIVFYLGVPKAEAIADTCRP